MKDTTSRQKELGDFLRMRRERLSPTQAGIPEGGRRRTPGLRREEVAALAGIGLTWYTWLEQGRHIQVSGQVLESLARTLRLNQEETRYLFSLARCAMPDSAPPKEQRVTPILRSILDNLLYSPSLILDMRWNILAWNQAARAATLDFAAIPPERRNYIRLLFTDREYRNMFDNWDQQARAAVARFRADWGSYIDDPWLLEFVREMSAGSSRFARWWPDRDVENEKECSKVFLHPKAGRLTFEHACMVPADNRSLKLFVNVPAPGTDTEEKMRTLISGLPLLETDRS